jgi:hypothetical protein
VNGRWERDLTVRGLVGKELTREGRKIKRATELVVYGYIPAYITDAMQVQAVERGRERIAGQIEESAEERR